MSFNLSSIPDEVMISAVTAAILASLALMQRAVTTALLYLRHQIDLDYDSAWGACDWDIQWEDFRITVKARDVSNNRVHDFQISVNKGQSAVVPELFPSNRFVAGPSTKLQYKLLSIVRTKPEDIHRRYRLTFVFRRRRW